jgi:hypothetical protein
MFVRVFCDRCRVSPAWTDDPAAILDDGCRHPADCAARLVDEQLAIVKLGSERRCRFAIPPPRSPLSEVVTPNAARSGFSVALVPCVAALLASLALASAYESAAMVPTFLELAAPAVLALVLYRSSPKATIVALLCLAGAALAIDTLGSGPMLARPFNGLLLVSAAIALPVFVDLELVDLGRLLGGNVVSGIWIGSTFAILTALLLVVEFPRANQIARREDEAIVRRLVPRLRAQGHLLVLDRLDPRLASDAERRLSILAGGRRYELAGASAETVAEPRSVATRDQRLGIASFDRMERDGKDLVTLVLPLRGDRAPDEVEIEGVRGPETVYDARVALAK